MASGPLRDGGSARAQGAAPPAATRRGPPLTESWPTSVATAWAKSANCSTAIPRTAPAALASACAVGEVLRAYAEDILELGPTLPFPLTMTLLESPAAHLPPKVNHPA